MELGLPVLLAIVIGYFLKKHPEVDNKLIPALLFASQFVGRLMLELGVSSAHAGGLRDFFKAAGPQIGDMVWASLVTSVAAVGAHSTGKNSKQGLSVFLQAFRLQAAAKAAAAAEKALVKIAGPQDPA